MNYCAIGPLAARELFEEQSHHMALAQYLYNRNYFEFYKELIAKGKFVILDSGVYEKAAVDDDQLLYWIAMLVPSAIILPDVPHDFEATAKRSIKFAARVKEEACHQPQLWKVLHALRHLDTFATSYLYDSNLFDAVCFSRLTEQFGDEAQFQKSSTPRVAFIRWLQEQKLWRADCYHHCLGMINGSLSELYDLKNLGVNSFDSSAPIWRPLNARECRNEPTPFDIPFNPFAKVSTEKWAIEGATRSLAKVNSICQPSSLVSA